MDLLGSILGKMDTPPMTASDKEALQKAKGKKKGLCGLKSEILTLVCSGILE